MLPKPHLRSCPILSPGQLSTPLTGRGTWAPGRQGQSDISERDGVVTCPDSRVRKARPWESTRFSLKRFVKGGKVWEDVCVAVGVFIDRFAS